MSDAAAGVGLSEAALYRHVDSKEGLVVPFGQLAVRFRKRRSPSP